MIVAIIQARLGSTRFPGKVLKSVLGRPLLAHMMERVSHAQLPDQVVIATTGSPADDPIVTLCEQNGYACFRGSDEDVLDRYYRAAQQFGADVVVRLTSDCPLLDPTVIDQVVSVFRQGEYDYVANTVPPPGTYPDGMDVEVFSLWALEQSWQETVKPSDREHVTFYLWRNPHKFRTYRIDCIPDWSDYRLTVDHIQDFLLVKAILETLSPHNPLFSLEEIVDFLEENPHIKGLNRNIARNQGWQTALQKDREAGF